MYNSASFFTSKLERASSSRQLGMTFVMKVNVGESRCPYFLLRGKIPLSPYEGKMPSTEWFPPLPGWKQICRCNGITPVNSLMYYLLLNVFIYTQLLRKLSCHGNGRGLICCRAGKVNQRDWLLLNFVSEHFQVYDAALENIATRCKCNSDWVNHK